MTCRGVSYGRMAMLGAVLLCAAARGADMNALKVTFENGLTAADGALPTVSEQVVVADGEDAVSLCEEARLAYPGRYLSPSVFTIRLRVKHERPLREYFFKRLVYLHHETQDMKNRVGIHKRAGSNSFVFFMSDAQGRAKGRCFGGDWFAMATGAFDWEAGSWHELVCTADREAGMAQFFIDGVKVAQAEGTQFPEQAGEQIWVGSEQGHNSMDGDIGELSIEPVSSLDDAPLAPRAAPMPIPPVTPLFGCSVGKLTGKELTANLDFFDVCIGVDTWDLRYCDAEMDRLMALTAYYGHDRVFFRVSICGAVCYHTKVMTPAFENVFKAYEGKDLIDGCCASIPSEIPRMAAVMRQIDPLASCAAHARRHGMSCYAWVTSFDSLYYAPEEEFFRRHPEFTWVSRDGTKHIPGVPCYAYPEVREYRLAQVRELCAYDIDGIMFSPRSHSPWPGRNAGGGNEGSRGYGFNEPVIQAYRERYGKDPRDSAPDSLDELRFVQLKADFYTQFVREAAGIARAAGKKIVVMASEAIADPVRATWMMVDAETMARERIADELCIMGSPGADMNRWRLLSDGQVKVTTWGSIHGTDYEQCAERMQRGFRAMLDNPTSAGSTFHELANLLYPDCWEEGIVETLTQWQESRGQTR